MTQIVELHPKTTLGSGWLCVCGKERGVIDNSNNIFHYSDLVRNLRNGVVLFSEHFGLFFDRLWFWLWFWRLLFDLPSLLGFFLRLFFLLLHLSHFLLGLGRLWLYILFVVEIVEGNLVGDVSPVDGKHRNRVIHGG